MSKLIILLFGFLAGSLIFSGLATKDNSINKTSCVRIANIQSFSVLGDFELLDFSEDETDFHFAVQKSFSDGRWQKEEVLPDHLIQILFLNQNLPPGQYSNLPPPVYHVVLYS